jgi:hypothetical protein
MNCAHPSTALLRPKIGYVNGDHLISSVSKQSLISYVIRCDFKFPSQERFDAHTVPINHAEVREILGAVQQTGICMVVRFITSDLH